MNIYLKFLNFFLLLLLSINAFSKDKINFCSITVNSSDEINAFKNSIRKEEIKSFNFIELTNELEKELIRTKRQRKDVYYTDWTKLVSERLKRQKINCDILLISAKFAGEVFYGVGKQSEKRLRTKHMVDSMCSKSSTNIFHSPSLVYLFAGNTFHNQDGASSKVRTDYYSRINKVIGKGAAQRLVEAKYGPYGKAYDDQIKRIFHPHTTVYGFIDKGISGKNAGRKFKNYLKSFKSFKDLFLNGPYKIRNSIASDDATTKNVQILDKAFLKYFKDFGGVKSKSTNLKNSDELTSKICKIRNNSVLRSQRMEQIEGILKSRNKEVAYTVFPWIEEFFRENPPKFDGMGNAYYQSGLENTQLKKLKSLEPKFFDDYIYKTKLGYPRIQLLTIGYYLGWLDKDRFEKGVTKILKKELVNIKNIDRDTYDLICQLAPGLAPIFKKDEVLKRYANNLGSRLTIKRNGKVYREINTLRACFEKELKK